MRLLAAALFAPLFTLLAGTAAAQNTNEPKNMGNSGAWEDEQSRRDWRENAVVLPPYPTENGLIEFTVSVGTAFRFFIDPASVSVGNDRVVRYTLIARSPSGVSNVSYEGIRCATASYKVFARGNNGQWSLQDSEWRTIEAKAIQRWHNELQRQYFCPLRGTILTAEEGVDALRRGKHPGVSTRPGY